MGETTLYDELEFLTKASKSVNVDLPGDDQKKAQKVSLNWIEDSVSTGQAGLLKKRVKTSTYKESRPTKKRLRFRSR